MSLSVYVAAPYADAPHVRLIHERLIAQDIRPTSTWASTALGPEDFSKATAAGLLAVAATNDADLRGSDAVLVLARDGAGGEMFAEARVALEWGRPCVWVGRRTLSAWRRGVVLAEDVDDALRVLVEMRRHHAIGARGMLLAHLVSGAG